MYLNSLIFPPKHIQKILSGAKHATIRLWLGPVVDVGATVLLVDSHQGKPFAMAQITGVERKELCALNREDLQDSQHTESLEELAQKMSAFYDQKVTVDSDVVVIRFKIISDGQEESEYDEIQSQQKRRWKGMQSKPIKKTSRRL